MKKTLTLFALLLLVAPAAAQNSNTTKNAAASANANTKTNANAKTTRRGPVFRANKEQIKQAQALLKQRAHYAGEQTGKLDDPTREALRKYQQAEGLKVTGTLNAPTLERMNIQLTDRQKEIRKQVQAPQGKTAACAGGSTVSCDAAHRCICVDNSGCTGYDAQGNVIFDKPCPTIKL